MMRNIFVAGATGKTGQALIRALLGPAAGSDGGWHISALTRNASSPAAKRLTESYPSNLTVVEGNLDDRESIIKIFENAKNEGGIWGVFCVLAYPGMGADASGEELQGKNLADVSLQYGVETFVYSSAMRMGPKYEETLERSHKAKRNIENHCKELGEKGLNWTILHPGFFLENFDGLIGSIGVAVLKNGLKPETDIAFVASEDIGNVAAGVFASPEKYKDKVLAVVCECCTMRQLEDAHQRATGKPIPAVPASFAWIITRISKATQSLLAHIELNYNTRISGEYPSVTEEIGLANQAYKMKGCYEWFKLEKEGTLTEQKNWNQLSIGKLFTGR
ncbi:NAD(P)-binding protein [Hyaloscypha hepaticicola]|uniref:NAD(P)-binding protein n=1 Tax=Hyaloscypha hepaticicola TaxID=2082293 RepID=A0A2J6Q8I9_9HELO|nr:NAD(P)-binding protein [Hyaloscypha hepaticicola]